MCITCDYKKYEHVVVDAGVDQLQCWNMAWDLVDFASDATQRAENTGLQ